MTQNPTDIPAVGYMKPPKESQFKAGRSGNPLGRPKVAKPKAVGGFDKMSAIILEEAYREVEVKENGVTVRMPVIQATLRSIALHAATGNRKSQELFVKLVTSTETGLMKASLEVMQAATTYKEDWEVAKSNSARTGHSLPNPVPHPDDVVIDSVGMRVFNNGPRDDHEKATWDDAARQLALFKEMKANVTVRRGKATKAGKADLDTMILRLDYQIALLNAVYPDELTRREPGFDITVWRSEKTPALKKLETAVKRLDAEPH